MTIFLASSCQTILQKSGVVALSGPYKKSQACTRLEKLTMKSSLYKN